MLSKIYKNPLDALLQDPEITEIMVNGLEGVYIEKRGKLQQTEIRFESEEELSNFIKAVVASVGREISETDPMANIGLDDGTMFNAVLAPIAMNGPSVTIRKRIDKQLSWDELVSYESLTPKMRDLLEALVNARLNIVVAGGTLSGKTTIINALSEFIPNDQRLVTIERLQELQLRHPHVVRLAPRGADSAGKGEVTMKDLMINATMMRADRLWMAEVKGAEVWDMLQAMSSGYEGSLFGIHATSTQDVLERIEMMATASTNLPLLQIRTKMAQSINVIVQQLKGSDGKRRIVSIAEVTGIRGGIIETQEIVRFEGSQFAFTGYVPTFAQKLEVGGDNFFRG